MPNYDWECSTCACPFEAIVPYEKLEQPELTCPECQATDIKRIFTMPSIRTRGSATFVDGQKRPGWDDLKAISKLKVAKARSNDPAEKDRIAGEIRIRQKTMKGEQLAPGVKLADSEK